MFVNLRKLGLVDVNDKEKPIFLKTMVGQNWFNWQLLEAVSDLLQSCKFL